MYRQLPNCQELDLTFVGTVYKIKHLLSTGKVRYILARKNLIIFLNHVTCFVSLHKLCAYV